MSIRITQQSISASTMRGLQSNLSRMQVLQAQLSSGKRISVASDDPSGTASAMTYRSQQAADEQYLRNIDQVSARLGVTDSTLTSLSDRLRSVRELLIQANNAGMSAQSRAALSSQNDTATTEIYTLSLQTSSDLGGRRIIRSEHTSELQSHSHLVCRLLLETKTTHVPDPLRGADQASTKPLQRKTHSQQ